ncbi:hypothetical protein GGD56_006593 [Rhizobium mongolense]|uniref:Uncharacterized protein n=2 Tax=Rhizobium mongolense TaxID=57676 RepID=A0ABR6IXQ2_9HYPH|nr:hypothetical protein [Rhizobium mongolense]TVZ75202.1 hypothetical protein BCL32_0644 [Rhizobium mongolense USDA 1844]
MIFSFGTVHAWSFTSAPRGVLKIYCRQKLVQFCQSTPPGAAQCEKLSLLSLKIPLKPGVMNVDLGTMNEAGKHACDELAADYY